MEFTTHSQLWDAAWTWGWAGDPVAHPLNAFRRAFGRPLADWERAAILAGHAVGLRDREQQARDRAEMEAAGTGPFAQPDDDSELPF